MNNGEPIQLLILDVDGVLTDGLIHINDEGQQTKSFHVQDGLGITLFKAIGGKVAILTSKKSPAVLERARMLEIELVEAGAEDKLPGFERLLAQTGVSAKQTAYVGDDLLDAVVLRRCGYPIAVNNAVEEVKALAKYVTVRSGGRGAVREAIEHLLQRQGQWATALHVIGADR